ncbi:MAG: hypothetical protein A4E29_01786 [Methanomassiliicoccales archaeon PtaB.Bin134]|nr:MAG: hypothetical protein A4E29_01786 [Methanomassiliicoccales archaeon PtaB.Bin134]
MRATNSVVTAVITGSVCSQSPKSLRKPSLVQSSKEAMSPKSHSVISPSTVYSVAM